MNSFVIRSITDPVDHAEGPHWDHLQHIFYYVDTFNATILRYDPKKRETTTYKIDNRNSIGIIIPLKHKQNEFIVGADRVLYKFIWNGKSNDGKLVELLMVDNDKMNNQFNDGKADKQGRLWIGSLTRNKDKSVNIYGGCLYQITTNGKPIAKIPNTCISNGIAWNQNNKRFYFIDSDTKLIMAYDFDDKNGDISNGKAIFDLRDHPHLTGILDGMTIDSEDNLWVALFGGGGVIKINSKTGELMAFIQLPSVTYVTSCTFGGDNFATLFVTTSRLKLDTNGRKNEPLAGCVFTIDNLGVKGTVNNECLLNI